MGFREQLESLGTTTQSQSHFFFYEIGNALVYIKRPESSYGPAQKGRRVGSTGLELLLNRKQQWYQFEFCGHIPRAGPLSLIHSRPRELRDSKVNNFIGRKHIIVAATGADSPGRGAWPVLLIRIGDTRAIEFRVSYPYPSLTNRKALPSLPFLP